MSYENYADWNKTGLDQMFLYVANVMPVFIPMMLFSIYSIVLLGTYFSSKRISGDGDFAASVATAGFLTFIISLVLTLIPGLINTQIVVITLVIAIVGILFLFFSKRR